MADGWESASDSGWNAAESLLRGGDEEVTHAGLPKRVPNAYLVPGSVRSDEESAGSSFTDTTSAHPGEGAMARSAEAARNKMMNFQRGYTRGRHALTHDAADEHDAAAVGVAATGERTTENGVRE